MNAKLQVQQNQVTYGALFSRPAFSLWGNGEKILKGLFTAFSKRGVTLANFRFDHGAQDPGAQSVTVSFGATCNYKFKLDRVESSWTNFRRAELDTFSEILQEGAAWLRSSINAFGFQSHLFTYFDHSQVLGATAKDVLSTLPTLPMPEIGTSEGNGIIFHWKVGEQWKVQLMIDHSLAVQDGLFTQLLLFVTGDAIDYSKTVADGRSIIDRVLKTIGLEIDDGA